LPKAEIFQDTPLPTSSDTQELWRWLYTELRAAILDGRLKRGARLPSTRSLAQQYGLSRGTVTTAFDQLQAEGYTRTEVGSGTYVASGLPDRTFVARSATGSAPNLPPSKATLSKRAQGALKDIKTLPATHSVGKAFRSYEPAIDLFPVDLWARISARVLRRAPRSLYGQGSTAGYQPLRRAIAEYIGGSRGVRCSPDQVIVTSGAQQALDLIGRLLLDPGDRVWMEDPGYSGACWTLRAAGAHIVPIPVDQDGLVIEAARKLSPQAKLAYVTPANQFPLGVTMSAERRMELLEWAVNARAWVVEDEYDAEYRYHGRPVARVAKPGPFRLGDLCRYIHEDVV
jgi:GntR family transcriptional regulator/MocR family aminotransferase